MYEYDDDEEGGRSTGRLVAMVAGVVVLALVGWFVIKPKLGSDDASGATVIPATSDAGGTTGSSDASGGSAPAADGPDDSQGDAATTAAPTTDAAPATTAAAATTSTAAAPVTTVAATTTAPPAAAPPAAPAVTYSTLPDGSPVPILALYDTDRVTLSGNVPDQASKDLLGSLALATAKPEQAGLIVNDLTIDPSVPRTIGVRVVELTSARFPEGSAEVTLEQAAEINRLANILNQLPNLTALVIGHADQRGDETTNYVVSEQRADAIVDYLVSQGIAPSRLSSRAVGEDDLLTLDNEPAALALNRRTEFVLYGLLAL